MEYGGFPPEIDPATHSNVGLRMTWATVQARGGRNDRANNSADNRGDHPSGTAFSLFETHQSAITYRRDRQMPIAYVCSFARQSTALGILVQLALLCADDVDLRSKPPAEPDDPRLGAAERFPSLLHDASAHPCAAVFRAQRHMLGHSVSLACSAFDPLRGSHPKINRPSRISLLTNFTPFRISLSPTQTQTDRNPTDCP